MVRHTLKSLGPKVLATRMVRDYIAQPLRPGGRQRPARSTPTTRAPPTLAAWKKKVKDGWSDVRVEHVESEGVGDAPEVGDALTVRAFVCPRRAVARRRRRPGRARRHRQRRRPGRHRRRRRWRPPSPTTAAATASTAPSPSTTPAPSATPSASCPATACSPHRRARRRRLPADPPSCPSLAEIPRPACNSGGSSARVRAGQRARGQVWRSTTTVRGPKVSDVAGVRRGCRSGGRRRWRAPPRRAAPTRSRAG